MRNTAYLKAQLFAGHFIIATIGLLFFTLWLTRTDIQQHAIVVFADYPWLVSLLEDNWRNVLGMMGVIAVGLILAGGFLSACASLSLDEMAQDGKKA